MGKGERGIEDEEIIQHILDGESAVFRLLIDRYKEHLFRIAYSVLHHPKDAEDAAQEAWVQIYASLPGYRFNGFKTWITRIAVNKAIDYKRRSMKPVELTASVEDLAGVAGSNQDVQKAVLRNHLKERMKRKLDEVPENYREVLYAFYFEEKTYQEIAREQGIEIKSVESKLYRAKNWIRKRWKEEEFW